MTLLITALIILFIAALAIMALQAISTDANLTKFGTLAIIIIAMVVILQRSGLL